MLFAGRVGQPSIVGAVGPDSALETGIGSGGVLGEKMAAKHASPRIMTRRRNVCGRSWLDAAGAEPARAVERENISAWRDLSSFDGS